MLRVGILLERLSHNKKRTISVRSDQLNQTYNLSRKVGSESLS